MAGSWPRSSCYVCCSVSSKSTRQRHTRLSSSVLRADGPAHKNTIRAVHARKKCKGKKKMTTDESIYSSGGTQASTENPVGGGAPQSGGAVYVPPHLAAAPLPTQPAGVNTFCAECGAANPGSVKFCQGCGASF